MHYGVIWAAIREALNLSGIGSLIAGLFLITKSKGDAKTTLAQLRQKAEADDRTAEQTDVKLLSDQRAGAAAELEKTNLRLAAQLERAETKNDKLCAELDMRNTRLAECGTNFPELFVLIGVAGAVDLLRHHRDEALKHEREAP